MAEHFNYTKLPTWHSLTDSERRWVGILARLADDNQWVKKWRYSRHCVFLETWTENAHKYGQVEFFKRLLCESLMLTLTTPEPTYMLSSLLQASEYLGRLHEPDPSFSEAYQVAKIRAERLLIPRES